MNKALIFIGFLLFTLSYACVEEQIKEDKAKIVTEYFDDGKTVKATATVNEKRQRHGRATRHYADGSVESEIFYQNNIKHGAERKFYTNGKLYRERNYANGLISGFERKFHKNGVLMSEVEYKDGNVSVFLKEYNDLGVEAKEYPTLVLEKTVSSQFTLSFWLSSKSKEVEFYYVNELIENKFLDKAIKPLKQTESDKVKIVIPLSEKGKEVIILAKINTKYHSPKFLIEKIVL